VRNASWPEGKAAGLHLDRLVGTDVEADLAFEHNPYLVVSPVKMQRRHVAGRTDKFDDRHRAARFVLSELDLGQVRSSPGS